MEILDPFDGMPANDIVINIACPCGDSIRLWYNGGELDERLCTCGKTYWTESLGTVLRVSQ